MKPLFI
jgi:hypothetical protein